MSSLSSSISNVCWNKVAHAMTALTIIGGGAYMFRRINDLEARLSKQEEFFANTIASIEVQIKSLDDAKNQTLNEKISSVQFTLKNLERLMHMQSGQLQASA